MTIYLYVKQHTKTGLKYFGKTICNPDQYYGSGIYWLKHIKKHGTEYVKTCQVWEFETQEECTRFALEFSKENNIVESSEWANLIEENGSGGGSNKGKTPWNKGKNISEKHKQNISNSLKGFKNPQFQKPRTEETRIKISNSLKGSTPWNKGIERTKETKFKISNTLKNKKLTVDRS